MCVIIDANIASLVFRQPPDKDFAPVFHWLDDVKKDGRVVYGGQLARELSAVEAARRYLLRLQQAGRARLIPDRDVGPEEKRVVQTGLCKSDDPHVIALARIGGARTLCSQDKRLQKDFRNRELIKNPRGCVYQRPEHACLLRHTGACQHPWRRRGR